MECPRRWAVLYTILFFLIQIANVYCQIEPLEEISTNHQTKDLKRDVSKILGPSSKTLPEKTFVANIKDDRSRTVNVISQPPSCFSQVPSAYPPACCNGVSRIPLENYANMVQLVPAIRQLSQSSNDVHNHSPVNLQITSASPSLATINTQPGIVEFLSEINRGALQNEYEDGIPLNLQINVPSQNVAGPRITVVSATPAPVTSANSDSVLFPQFPPPAPPIIRKSRSYWRNLLPILLIALLNDQDCCGNGCCCPCNCNSDSPIPIPYPIPIPVNNPIINNDGTSYSPRKRGQRDYEDDNDGKD